MFCAGSWAASLLTNLNDSPAVFYSFSWAQNPNWTSFHPEGKEIVRYLQGVCENYKIVDKIQLNTDVKECQWNEKEGIWDITLLHMVNGIGDLTAYERRQRLDEQGPEAVYLREEKVKAKVVVSSVGGLVEPKLWPDSIPGKDKFQGEIFHSARWKYDVDLKDKDVVVLGTGCSAAQFVPRLPKEYGAKTVTQIMRSPPWVVPRLQPPGGEESWAEWGSWYNNHIPGFRAGLRFMIFISAEHDFIRLFKTDEYSKKGRALLEADLIAHMKKTVPRKYWEILTPDYDVCCKFYDLELFLLC
jgi:cation diffusion facilitator CzcD-associated flavoprotein CzcO